MPMSTISVYYCMVCTVCAHMVCSTVVCVLFVATLMSTISVFYFSIGTLLKYVYCLWPLPHLLFVCTTLVLFVCTTLVLFMCTNLVLFVCNT